MALFEINTKPSDRQLRQFGLICVVLFPLVVWMWNGNATAVIVSAVFGAAYGVLAVAAPRLLKPVFVGLMFVTLPLGLIIGELIMLLIFFGLFLPIALLFRISGRDALQRKVSTDAVTFWKPRKPSGSVRGYYRQF